MGKYIKKFSTVSQYEAYMGGGGEVFLPNVSLIEETMGVEFNPYVEPQAPGNIITYGASAKLTEVTSEEDEGLHTNAFNTTIKSHTFENGVGTIEFNDNVTSIGNYAFNGCTSLTSIIIPSSVTSIGDSAFQNCIGLTNITIPSSVTSIDNWAFYYCTGLTSITIPSSVTTIGGSAFDSCSGLTSIIVDSGNSTYDSRNNCNAIINTNTNELISGCKNTVIPNSVTSIGSGAFDSCSGLTSITIPSGVTSIGQGAFAFCSGLTSITIPSSVTSIGDYAFTDCESLSSVTVNATTPPTLGSNAFDNNADNRKIYVPNISFYDYRHDWEDYELYIYPIGS